MPSRIALTTIMVAYCSVHTCIAAAVIWPDATCPLVIPESTSKDNLKTFAVTDVTNYRILSQNVTGRFALASNGTLSSMTELDYESVEKSYSLVIVAFNAALENATLTCEIEVTDINDEEPLFVQESYSVNIPNNVAKDTSVLTVSATDSDVKAEFNEVVYSIKGDGSGNFSITSDTGVISAAINVTGPQTFKITVVAKDNNRNEFTDEASVYMCIRCTSGSSSLEISMFAFMALVFGSVMM